MYIWQKTSYQDTGRTHKLIKTTQKFKEKKKVDGKDFWIDISQRRYLNRQKAHKTMLNSIREKNIQND